MTTARGFLGAGDLYISRYDTGTLAFLPYQGPYESTKFQIKATTKLVEMTSRSRDGYGQLVESVPLPQPTEFEIALAEVNKESLTLALLGTQASLTQSSGTATDEVVVACTQEQRLFGDLAAQAQAKTSVIKFVNIRETGGWSRDAASASPIARRFLTDSFMLPLSECLLRGALHDPHTSHRPIRRADFAGAGESLAARDQR